MLVAFAVCRGDGPPRWVEMAYKQGAFSLRKIDKKYQKDIKKYQKRITKISKIISSTVQFILSDYGSRRQNKLDSRSDGTLCAGVHIEQNSKFLRNWRDTFLHSPPSPTQCWVKGKMFRSIFENPNMTSGSNIGWGMGDAIRVPRIQRNSVFGHRHHRLLSSLFCRVRQCQVFSCQHFCSFF